MFGEVFHGNEMRKFFNQSKGISHDKVPQAIQRSLKKPVHYLNDLYSTKNDAHIGGKVVFSEIGWDNTIDFINKADDYQLVLLWRENLTQRYISAAHATQYKMWHIYDKKKQSQHREPTDIDLEWLGDKLAFEKPRFDKIREALDARGEYLDIEYADLFSNINKNMPRLLSFLGIQKPANIPNLPVKSVVDYSWVRNKNEVNDLFGEKYGYLP